MPKLRKHMEIQLDSMLLMVYLPFVVFYLDILTFASLRLATAQITNPTPLIFIENFQTINKTNPLHVY